MDRVLKALDYWQRTKLALDGARPDFTAEQLRELEAAEARLLALDIAAIRRALNDAAEWQ